MGPSSVQDRAGAALVLDDAGAAQIRPQNAPVRPAGDVLVRVADVGSREIRAPTPAPKAPRFEPTTIGPDVVSANSPDTDRTPTEILTPSQRAAIAANVAEARARASPLSVPSIPRIFDRNDANARVFVIAADGTKNDRRVFRHPGDRTNPDKIEQELHKIDDPRVKTTYISGPGTRPNDIVDAVTGGSTPDRAEALYSRFATQVRAWHRENPNINVSVVSMGFSRGSTVALMASNLIYERGVTAPLRADGSTPEPRYLIAPHASMPQAHLLYDHVSTNVSHVEGYSTALPPTSMFAAQLRADGEGRSHYIFHNVDDHTRAHDPRVMTLHFPGAHADIGGSYRQDGIAQQTRLVGEIVLGGLGLPVRESVPTEDASAYQAHKTAGHTGGRVNFDASRYFGSPDPDPALMKRFYGR